MPTLISKRKKSNTEYLEVFLYEYDYPVWFDDELTIERPDWQTYIDSDNLNYFYPYPSYLDEEYPDYDEYDIDLYNSDY